MPIYNPKELVVGTPVYCVIYYPSKIHRVQKLLTETNDKFLIKQDGNLILIKNWSLDYFFGYSEAVEHCRQLNLQELEKILGEISWYQVRYKNISAFLNGKIR